MWMQRTSGAIRTQMLNWTERIIRMRKEVPEVGSGNFAILGTGEHCILALRYDWRNNSVLFVHNLAAAPREVSFAVDAPGDPGTDLVNLLSNDHSHARAEKHHLTLEAYAYRWYRVGGLGYLLKRSDLDSTTIGG